MTFKQWIHDTWERVYNTMWQATVVYFIAAQKTNYGNGRAIVAALLPALITVLLSVLTVKVPFITNKWGDIAYRVIRTWVTVVGGAALADGFDLFQMNAWTGAFIAGASAVLVVVKGLLAAKLRPGTLTPASFAKP